MTTSQDFLVERWNIECSVTKVVKQSFNEFWLAGSKVLILNHYQDN